MITQQNNDTRRKIKQLEAVVAGVIRETPDTATLILFTGNDKLEYKAGHFLTIDPHQFEALHRFIDYLEDLKGKKEPARAYSLASSPDERHLAITVKEERYVRGITKYPPILSPLLVCRTPVGTKMIITGFTGPYTFDDSKAGNIKQLFHVCAGSGIVPNYSIIKYCLKNYPSIRHKLIYSSKTLNDIIYRGPLEQLEKDNSDKIEIHYFLTREENAKKYGPRFNSGRVTSDGILKKISGAEGSLFYICGPAISKHEKESSIQKGEHPKPKFMESVLQILEDIGIPKERIKKESYG